MIDATYLPQELIDLQKELMRKEHEGLFIKIYLEHAEGLSEVTNQMDFLTLLCTVLRIELDGEYNIADLANKILPILRNERLNKSIITLH